LKIPFFSLRAQEGIAASPQTRRRRTALVQDGLAILCVAAMLIFNATARGINLLLGLGTLIVGGVFVGRLVGVRSLRGLRASRKTPDAVYVGEPFYVEIELDATSRRRSSWAIVVEDCWENVKRGRASFQKGKKEKASLTNESLDDDLAEKLDEASTSRPVVYFPSIRKGERLKAYYAGIATRRGRRALLQLTISTRFPFGFFRIAERFEAKGSIVAFPKIGVLTDSWRAFADEATRENVVTIDRTSRMPDETTSIREWVPSDARRSIAWRATARCGRLMAREYVRRGKRSVVLVLDLFQNETSNREKEVELAVSFVATLIDRRCAQRDAQIFATLNADESEDAKIKRVSDKDERDMIEWNAVDAGDARRAQTRLAFARSTEVDRLREILEDAQHRFTTNATIIVASVAPVDAGRLGNARFEGARFIDVSSAEFQRLFHWNDSTRD